MQYLKADTAATILIGPFVDKGDGVTPETGVTLAAADHAELMKHDGTTFVDLTADSRTFTHKEGGWYTLVLGTGDTDTEGRLTVLIMDTDVCLPVWKDFMVVNANVYDSLYAAATTDYLQTDVTQIGSTAVPNTSGKLHVLQGDGNAITAVGPTKTEMDNGHAAIVADTEDLQTQIGTDGAGLTDLGGMSTGMKAEVEAEAETSVAVILESSIPSPAAGESYAEAISFIVTLATRLSATRAGYLDELAAANIPADVDTLKVVIDKLADTLEDDAGTYRFTENALEEAPSGTGGDATEAKQDTLIQILTGKWEVVGNQFIIYDSDGVTPLYTYNLTQDGVPTEFNPDLRTPV